MRERTPAASFLVFVLLSLTLLPAALFPKHGKVAATTLSGPTRITGGAVTARVCNNAHYVLRASLVRKSVRKLLHTR